MNFANTWYVIERNNHFETISHEAMSLLPEGSYVMLQNFATHHEALEEHKRLVRLAIDEMKHKLGS
ncbi:hypothetical protein LMORI2_17890 [Limnohabitans sp. MORI2]|jgi:hypothetical protein|uniref:hypothetical protein n=1 Tax=Limnohabitans sp. MORI2 TaxID=1751150 RepID=UPI00237734A1|nr:hypothetical protein [Limnohabitans sp. MORI2]BDU58807.1 hypothetical protein LMORI2_17890 [Limnohabitans sp. MORI2]